MPAITHDTEQVVVIQKQNENTGQKKLWKKKEKTFLRLCVIGTIFAINLYIFRRKELQVTQSVEWERERLRCIQMSNFFTAICINIFL